MSPSFVPGVRAPGELEAGALSLAFRERELLVVEDEGGARLPRLDEIPLPAVRKQYLGTLDGRQVVSIELDAGVAAPAGMRFLGLRELHGRLAGVHCRLAFQAVQIVAWDRDHQFCGRCGAATEDHPEDRAKRCPACALAHYPRLAPAVIVLVERGDEVLLARSPHFAPGVYSTLAGFVEPGETLEEAVAREIEEEVGVRVGDVRYFGSQAWPFPHSLMIGFKARYLAGEIRLAEPEIEAAGWFRVDTLPPLPSSISIARTLIEDFIARKT